MVENRIYYCDVCGLKQQEPPWGFDGDSPSFDICVCCGVEFGYEDCSQESATRYRKKWIESGAKWFDPSRKPDDWDLKAQLKNISIDLDDVLKNNI